MLSRKALAVASLSTIVCSVAAGAGAEDAFKSSKFLTYPADAQTSYISSSVMMAGTIASKNALSQSRCIDDWAVKNGASGFQPIVEAMRKFPDYHPTAVIFAVLQKACGSFEYARK
ncbi:hypothetical protein [Hyphomicrobium sp. NDB2Meth4]|uniref:hypothetical protein n=1 Tax=Hyphomicrobium sp. NDB2Meth4 TaxID=1892846 RepID=UPI0009318915|nr:hypothetical protein [Hyphomicrobium sp. NDB2Meth4]